MTIASGVGFKGVIAFTLSETMDAIVCLKNPSNGKWKEVAKKLQAQ